MHDDGILCAPGPRGLARAGVERAGENVGVRMINGQSYIWAFRQGLLYKSGKGFSGLWAR